MAKQPSPKVSADPFVSLEQDHRAVEQLFERLEQAHTGASRLGVFLQIKSALGLHAMLEEHILYPAARSCPDVQAQTGATRAYDAHDDVKGTLAEIEMTSPEDPIFQAKCAHLKGLVAQHVAEEEAELFPLTRKLLGPERLATLGRRIERTRAMSAEVPADRPAAKQRPQGRS